MSKDKIGDRMKENYENRTKQFLVRRTNTIIRLDGKSFSQYTRGLDKPFDQGLIEDMQETTKYLCTNVQGCKLGYTQSDEITLVLTDYDNLQTEAWFDGNVQKITSISAAMATAKFNELRNRRTYDESKGTITPYSDSKLPVFDSRVFQIPESEEVVNCLIWRQQDAERNSIQMLAQSLYSHKQLHGKNTSVLQDMCWEKGCNWNDLEYYKKRGSLILKNLYVNDKLMHLYRKNTQWCTDKDEDVEIGDLWLQTDVESSNYPNKKGRLLEWGKVNNRYVDLEGNYIEGEDWYEVPIEKVRNVWESVETPIFSKNRDVILNLLR